MSAFEQALDKVKDVAEEVTGKVREVMGEVSAQVGEVAEPAWKKTKDLADAVTDQVTAAAGQVGAAAAPTWGKVTDVAGTVTERVGNLAGEVKDMFSGGGTGAADAGRATPSPSADAGVDQERAGSEATESATAPPGDSDTEKT